MPDSKPTLISAILAGCAAVEDGRQPDDIMLRAVSRLGDLATEVRIASGHCPEAAPGEDGVAGAAMDLLLCIADHLRAHDPAISDARLVASMTSHPANLAKPLVQTSSILITTDLS